MNVLNKNGKISGVTQDQMILARSKLWTPELDKLLRKWKTQIGKRERGHLNLNRKFTRRHYILGGPAVVLSAVVAIGIFSTFRNCEECDTQQDSKCDVDVWIRIGSGIVGLFSAGLTAFLTFMNYADIAADHKSAADDFGSMFRNLDTMLIVPPMVRGDPQSTLQNIRNQYDNIVRRSPTLPSRYDVGLTFEFIEKTKLPKPPNPESIKDFINLNDKKDLDNLMLDDIPSEKVNNTINGLEEFLARENDYDTDDEDQEVKLPFDLDYSQNYNATAAAFAAAEMVSRREQVTQSSLQAALAFEIQRLESEDYPQQKIIKSSKNNITTKTRTDLPTENINSGKKYPNSVSTEKNSLDVEVIMDD
jgi:hypothetical protein